MKKRNAQTMQGALAGGTSGAAIGTEILPGWGTAIGAGAGALLGGIGGYMAGGADQQFDALNIDEQTLTNKMLARKNRNEQTMTNGMDTFRKFLGSAFKANSPGTMASALKPYPGLGNQGVQ